MSSRILCPRRFLSGASAIVSLAIWPVSAVLPLLPVASPSIRAQDNGPDPADLFLKAFTSAQQGETLEKDGRLKQALAKYRFAASLLEQLGQSNPNWQPLIVNYRIRKTKDSIQKLDEKIRLQPSAADSSLAAEPKVSGSFPAGKGARGNDPTEDDPLPAPDESSGRTGRSATASPPADAAPSAEALDRAVPELRAKMEKIQAQLNDTLNQLSVAQKEKKQALRDKQDFEFQLHSAKSGTLAAQKRLEHTKADRDELQAQVDKAEKSLKEAQGKNPQATGSRKELSDQVAELKKSLAKAQADNEAAAKAKEELEKKVAASEKLSSGGDANVNAAAGQDAAKIQGLEAENAILTQKLATAESTIAELHTESAKKKEELDGVRKELGTLKEQLASSRDQNDRSATTVTELHKQLDENAEQLTQLKAKGVTNADSLRLIKENELLRGIVMRQLKDQARRDQARELLKTELARLEVQSKTLDEQVEVLGRPTVQLSDEERALFKDPQVSISDGSTDSASMAASITQFRRKPGTDAGTPEGGAPTIEATPAEGSPSASPAATDASTASSAAEAAATAEAAPAGAGPKVKTAVKPPVADALAPLAKEALEDVDRGKYPEAEKRYEQLLAKEPKNPYLLFNQGVVLFKEDKLKSAEVSLRKATAISPKDAASQATLGIVYYRMRRYDEAISALTQAIQLDPKNATAHNYLGITSSQKGWPEAAIDEIQKAIALNPNYADAHFNIAVIYATNQPPAKDRAEEHYKIATSLGASPDPALEKLIRN